MADVGTASDDTTTAGPSLPVGTHVEVRSGLDDSWEPGFVVHEVTATGYRLRRETDGAILPDLPHQRVRRRRRRSTWWGLMPATSTTRQSVVTVRSPSSPRPATGLC